MSKLIKLYDMAAKDSSINVYDYAMELAPAISVHDESEYYIAMDGKKLKTVAERTVAFAHEMGHCNEHAFYNTNNELDVMERYELKANKWAVSFLIPENELLEAVENGIKEIYDLSEYFGVTEEFMKIALEVYSLDEEFVAEIEKNCHEDD